jgi:glycosyltransferase involved in cell wall biosynthesis
MSKRVFVPTLVDAGNLNAQINNVREILTGWDLSGWEVHALTYHEPDSRLTDNPHIHIGRLWRRHLWYLHMFLSYMRRYDLIFYPGVFPVEIAALRWRRRCGLQARVIVTLEGLLGDDKREVEYSAHAGHQVYCQPVSPQALAMVDERNHAASHIIAISPFLARMGRTRFGDKFSVLPLGINLSLFYPAMRSRNSRLRIVTAGGVKASKRPQLMLALASRFPTCYFIWYGDGDMRDSLIKVVQRQGLTNIEFPGALQAAQLGNALRAADLFVMPSRSEGVPKVTQEAAACGLAQVIFGYYEAPSVVDGVNGFVVWDDEQFFKRIGELIEDRVLLEAFGCAGAAMARDWDWGLVARQWRKRLLELA